MNIDSEQEILPRTRIHRKKSDTSKLDSILKKVKTNEEKKTELVKSSFWGFDNKIFIFVLIVFVICLIIVIIWFMWKNNEEEILNQQQDIMKHTMVPPGMHHNYVSPEYYRMMQQKMTQAKNNFNANKQNTENVNIEENSFRNIVRGKKKDKFGQVPGEQLDNPQLYNKKQVKFKDPLFSSSKVEDTKLSENKDQSNLSKSTSSDEQSTSSDEQSKKTVLERNVVQEEIDRQNAMDTMAIFDENI